MSADPRVSPSLECIVAEELSCLVSELSAELVKPAIASRLALRLSEHASLLALDKQQLELARLKGCLSGSIRDALDGKPNTDELAALLAKCGIRASQPDNELVSTPASCLQESSLALPSHERLVVHDDAKAIDIPEHASMAQEPTTADSGMPADSLVFQQSDCRIPSGLGGLAKQLGEQAIAKSCKRILQDASGEVVELVFDDMINQSTMGYELQSKETPGVKAPAPQLDRSGELKSALASQIAAAAQCSLDLQAKDFELQPKHSGPSAGDLKTIPHGECGQALAHQTNTSGTSMANVNVPRSGFSEPQLAGLATPLSQGAVDSSTNSSGKLVMALPQEATPDHQGVPDPHGKLEAILVEKATSDLQDVPDPHRKLEAILVEKAASTAQDTAAAWCRMVRKLLLVGRTPSSGQQQIQEVFNSERTSDANPTNPEERRRAPAPLLDTGELSPKDTPRATLTEHERDQLLTMARTGTAASLASSSGRDSYSYKLDPCISPRLSPSRRTSHCPPPVMEELAPCSQGGATQIRSGSAESLESKLTAVPPESGADRAKSDGYVHTLSFDPSIRKDSLVSWMSHMTGVSCSDYTALEQTQSITTSTKTANNCNSLDNDSKFQVLPCYGLDADFVPLMHSPAAAKTRIFEAEEEDDMTDLETITYNEKANKNDSHACDLPTWILVPQSSFFRFTWDLIGFMLMMYELFWLPMQFFDPPQTYLLRVATWITRMFWTIDVFLNFITGYLRADGSIEGNFKKIVQNYAKSWLCLDLMVVTIDWLEYLSDDAVGGQAARAAKALKLVRWLRLMRLMRLMKMPHTMNRMHETLMSSIKNERIFFVGKMVKIMLFIVAFVHITACLWYAIGNNGRKKEDGWVHYYKLMNESMEYRYLTSVHWSLTQFAGTMEVTPQLLLERLFAVIVLLIAWLISAGGLSIITTAMTLNSFSHAQQTLQLARLRRYLKENGISKSLMLRLIRNAKHMQAKQFRHMPEEDVLLLQLVSEPLRIELHFELNVPVLGEHPFFDFYCQWTPAAMRKVCHQSCSQTPLSRHDVLFCEGEVPGKPEMFFILSGELRYLQKDKRPRILGTGMWVCEACMWTKWQHRGMLKAISECVLLSVDAKAFMRIATKFTEESANVCCYANLFVDEVLNGYAKWSSYLNDVGPSRLVLYDMAERAFGKPEEKLNIKHGWSSTGSQGTESSRNLKQRLLPTLASNVLGSIRLSARIANISVTKSPMSSPTMAARGSKLSGVKITTSSWRNDLRSSTHAYRLKVKEAHGVKGPVDPCVLEDSQECTAIRSASKNSSPTQAAQRADACDPSSPSMMMNPSSPSNPSNSSRSGEVKNRSRGMATMRAEHHQLHRGHQVNRLLPSPRSQLALPMAKQASNGKFRPSLSSQVVPEELAEGTS